METGTWAHLGQYGGAERRPQRGCGEGVVGGGRAEPQQSCICLHNFSESSRGMLPPHSP